MVLDKQRHRLDWWLVPLAKALRGVDPNVFTWLSLLAAIFGGYAFMISGPENLNWLLIGWAMVLTNSVLDLLDGKVARLTGKMSAKGDFLDHAVDRFSDALFLGGLALSAWVNIEIALVAIIFTLLTSYLGTQAQAVGIGRNYGGLLGRADRMVMLLVIPVAQYVLGNSRGITNFDIAGFEHSLLGWMMIYFAVVGLITTVQRFASAYGAFAKDGSIKPQE